MERIVRPRTPTSASRCAWPSSGTPRRRRRRRRRRRPSARATTTATASRGSARRDSWIPSSMRSAPGRRPDAAPSGRSTPRSRGRRSACCRASGSADRRRPTGRAAGPTRSTRCRNVVDRDLATAAPRRRRRTTGSRTTPRTTNGSWSRPSIRFWTVAAAAAPPHPPRIGSGGTTTTRVGSGTTGLFSTTSPSSHA